MDDKTYVASFSQKLAEFRGKYGRKGLVGGSAKDPTTSTTSKPVRNPATGIPTSSTAKHLSKFYTVGDISGEDEQALLDAMSLDSPEAQAWLKKNNATKEDVYAAMEKARNEIGQQSQISQLMYAPKGEYSEERKAVHRKIIEDQLSKSAGGREDPRVLISGGFPGAGKTTMLKAGGYENFLNESAQINSDDIKGMLAKADGVEDWGALAGYYHEESTDVAADMLTEAMNRRMDITIDKTMQTPGKLIKNMDVFKQKKYKTEIAFADLPLRKAIERGIFRFYGHGGGKRGRFVDPVMIARYDSYPSKTMNMIKDNASTWAIWSTDVPFGQQPTLIDHGGSND